MILMRGGRRLSDAYSLKRVFEWPLDSKQMFWFHQCLSSQKPSIQSRTWDLIKRYAFWFFLIFHGNIQSCKISIQNGLHPNQSACAAWDLYWFSWHNLKIILLPCHWKKRKKVLSKMSFDTPWPTSFKLVCQNDLKETKLLFWGGWWNMKCVCPGAAQSEEGSTQAPVVYT